MDESDFERVGCAIVCGIALAALVILALFGWGFVEIVQWLTTK